MKVFLEIGTEMNIDALLQELPVKENEREILKNVLKKPDGSPPPLDSLSQSAAEVLQSLAIDKVRYGELKRWYLIFSIYIFHWDFKILIW